MNMLCLMSGRVEEGFLRKSTLSGVPSGDGGDGWNGSGG